MSRPQRIEPDGLAAVLPPGGLTLVSSCSAESALLAEMVATAGDALGDMQFAGVFVPGLNRRTWRAGARSRVLTFFQTPELRAEAASYPGRVEFMPLCYADILLELGARRPAAALVMCAPPDVDGNCSFGTETSFLADLWRDIPVLIAHINPAMPRTRGDPGIPFERLTAYIEAEQPLLGTPAAPADAVTSAIAERIADLVRGGDTLQVGLGKLPDAMLAALVDRQELKLRSGLIGDGLLALLDGGALTRATIGCAIGSPALYAALNDPRIEFRPTAATHGDLGGIDRLVTINSALQVDLFGQAYAEYGPLGWLSGPGGASDYARAARGRGTRIIALPSEAKGASRIVGPGAGAGPVSLSRFDIDVVVTEHGTADLQGQNHDARAAALIAIAAPVHRAALAAAWAPFAGA